MAHLDTDTVLEAVDVPAPESEAAAIDAFDKYLGDEEEEQPAAEEETETEETEEEVESEEEAEQEEADEDDEQETAIDAPVSFNAEEKAVFATLTPEQQESVAAIEARRNSQVQEATTKASEAQRVAEATAADATVKAKSFFAQQLATVAEHFAPQAPDPALAQHDPARYIAEKAQYDADLAQHNQIMQQATAIGEEAYNEDNAAFIQTRDRELMSIPEIANPETRNEALGAIFQTAQELGYDQQQIAEIAEGKDFAAFNTANGWRIKAEKYDAINAGKMAKVRAAKNKPALVTNRSGTAQPKGSGQKRALIAATTKLKQSGSDEDALAVFEAIGI